MRKCKPEDIKVKSLFLGRRSENHVWFKNEINKVLDYWYNWRISQATDNEDFISSSDCIEEKFIEQSNKISYELEVLLQRLSKEAPTFSPKYIGHMTSEITVPALLGHFSCLLHNPNMTSLEVSKEVSLIEQETIKQLGYMVGYDTKRCQGHICSGGTIANFEAVWRARYRQDQWLALGCYLNLHTSKKITILDSANMGWSNYNRYLNEYKVTENHFKKYSFVLSGPWSTKKSYDEAFGVDFCGPAILVPKNMHFSWRKSASIFGLGHDSIYAIDLDKDGCMDLSSLKNILKELELNQIPIMLIVGALGTTELGVFDPLDKVNNFISKYQRLRGWKIWKHVDAAYGGYYTIFKDDNEGDIFEKKHKSILKAISSYDSITLDPHKLGYVPYSCGVTLYKNELNYKITHFDAPYLINDYKEKWQVTMEGSRSGTGICATWLSNKSIVLAREGYGRILDKGILARKYLLQRLNELEECTVVSSGDTNILCFILNSDETRLSDLNIANKKIFEKINTNTKFSVSKTYLSIDSYSLLIQKIRDKLKLKVDTSYLLTIRCVLMNPFIVSKESNIQVIDEFIKEITILSRQQQASDQPIEGDYW